MAGLVTGDRSGSPTRSQVNSTVQGKDAFAASLEEASDTDQAVRVAKNLSRNKREPKAKAPFIRKVLAPPKSEAEKMLDEVLDGADTAAESQSIANKAMRRRGNRDRHLNRPPPDILWMIYALSLATEASDIGGGRDHALKDQAERLLEAKAAGLPAFVREQRLMTARELLAGLDRQQIVKLVETLSDPDLSFSQALALLKRSVGGEPHSLQADTGQGNAGSLMSAAAVAMPHWADRISGVVRDGRIFVSSQPPEVGELLVFGNEPGGGKPVAKLIHRKRVDAGEAFPVYHDFAATAHDGGTERGVSYGAPEYVLVGLPAYAGTLIADRTGMVEIGLDSLSVDQNYGEFADIRQSEIGGKQYLIGQASEGASHFVTVPSYSKERRQEQVALVDGRFGFTRSIGGTLFLIDGATSLRQLMMLSNRRPDGVSDFAAIETSNGRIFEIARSGHILWELKAAPSSLPDEKPKDGPPSGSEGLMRLPTERRGLYANAEIHGHRLLHKKIKSQLFRGMPSNPALPPIITLTANSCMTDQEYLATYGSFLDWDADSATGLWHDRRRVEQKCYNATIDMDFPQSHRSGSGVPTLLEEQHEIQGLPAVEATVVRKRIRQERLNARQ